MHIQARRIFRLAATTAIALAIAYALTMPMPFIAPMMAMMLTAKPAQPMGPNKLLGLLLVIAITLASGLLLIPLHLHYPFTAILIIALGIYSSFYLTINKGQALVGMFLTLGFTMISALGLVSFDLATTVIHALVGGIAIAIISQWIIYPLFPEDNIAQAKPADKGASQCNWIALRGTVVVLPVYVLVLINPGLYIHILVKGISLAQQSSQVNTHNAARELLGSTLLGGFFAVIFWMMLSIFTHLWMYFLLMLIFGIYFSSKIYQLLPSRYPASFWINVFMTMLILLGPAVEDTNTGDDVYTRFFVRISAFIMLTLYAVAAVYIIEYLRSRHQEKKSARQQAEPKTPEQIGIPDIA